MALVKTNNPDFVLDKASGALVNTNQDALTAYKAKRQAAKEQRDLAVNVEKLTKLCIDLVARVQALEARNR